MQETSNNSNFQEKMAVNDHDVGTNEKQNSMPKRKISDPGVEAENSEVSKKMKISNSDNNDCEDTDNSECEKNREMTKTGQYTLLNDEDNETDNSEREKNHEVEDVEQNASLNNQDYEVKKQSTAAYADCKICSKKFNGPQTYMEHLKSAGHKKKCEAFGRLQSEGRQHTEALECKICVKTFSGPIPFQQHLTSKGHNKNVMTAQLAAKFKTQKTSASDECDQAVAEGNNTKEDNQLSCEICNKRFSGLIPYDLHISSASHKKNVLRGSSANFSSNEASATEVSSCHNNGVENLQIESLNEQSKDGSD